MLGLFPVASFPVADLGLVAGPVDANLSVTESNDSLAASTALELRASLASTETYDVVTAAGALTVTALAFISEGDDTGAAIATLALYGALTVTESDDVPSASGRVDIVGTAAITEASDTFGGFGTVELKASLTVTEGDDSLGATALMPIYYPPRGGDKEWARYEQRQIEWQEQLRRIIDRSWLIANGEIDPGTFKPIPPPDYDAVIDALVRQAEGVDRDRIQAFVAEQERLQEEQAIAVLLLAA